MTYTFIHLNPLTAGAAYIRVFIFHVKDKMCHQPARFEKS